MISGIMHAGSGIGNQLHRFVGTKIEAIKRGEEHTMVAPELFKGRGFMDLGLKPNDNEYAIEQGTGRVIPMRDEGVLDGEFQSEEVWRGYEDQVKEWLKVEQLDMPKDLCVINFRGGEYTVFPDLFLPKGYWDMAIALILAKHPKMRFEIHTDDPDTACRFFPDYPIIRDIGLNWRSIRYAKNLILSNSSFAILPACIGESTNVVAPKYWAGYNQKEWINPDNATYSKFTYIHHEE